MLNSWLFCTGGEGSPGKAGGGCGDVDGEAVTDMSSSSGEWIDDPVVVSKPTWVLGDVLGEVVLWALLQFIEIGPSDDVVVSEKYKTSLRLKTKTKILIINFRMKYDT